MTVLYLCSFFWFLFWVIFVCGKSVIGFLSMHKKHKSHQTPSRVEKINGRFSKVEKVGEQWNSEHLGFKLSYYDCVLNVSRFYGTQENLSFTITKFMWKSCSHMLNVAVFIYYYCQYFFFLFFCYFSSFDGIHILAMRSYCT